MCGIAGFYGFRNDELIKKFSQELKHRGPDGEGYYIDDTVTLLNRRLAIIDRKGGDQPIYNEDKSLVVTYNGEIYNYRELRKELEKKGHHFSTASDTEVIVHGYEEWGESYFDRLNGMFGIALYDKKKKKLLLVRDHFGIKPVYYAFVSNDSIDSVTRDTPLLRGSAMNTAIRFSKSDFTRDTYRIIFSSEIKPILYSGLIKREPNDRIIYRYLKYRVHEDGDETFFDGIHRLLPGQMLIIQKDKRTLKQFSNLEDELLDIKGNVKVDKDSVKRFRKELINAIRLRLISEVPVGSCLSGGLDSSTVVSVVNRLLKKKVKEAESVGKIQNTFSAVFPNQSNDEEKYINKLKAQISNVKVFKTYPKPEEFFRDIGDFVRTQEEPTISTGPYAQYKVMQLAHKKITVALDGQGSDEMMAGYLPYYLVYLKELWKTHSFLQFLKECLTSLDVLIPITVNQLTGILGLKQFINVDKLLSKRFMESCKDISFSVTNDNLKKRLVEDIFHNSLQSLLRYEDRNAMRFSIEGRVPFLDFNLLKYLFSLSNEAIIKNGWNKYILRQSTDDLLPEIINKRRNKIGFTTPEYEWFMRMKNKIYSIFLSESFAKRKYFNQQEVLKAFQKFIEGKVDDTMIFWRMLNLELWLREFIDKKSEKLEVRCEKFAEPNEGKKLEIKVEGKTYYRFPIKTDLFKKGDDYAQKIADSILHYINIMKLDKRYRKLLDKKFYVVVSEKIVAIAQGRSYFIWDIKPSLFANILSKFVTKTPYGIGLGSPWTMELAIREVGAVRVIGAAIVAAIAKPFGIKGVFYRITGDTIRSIDGPTEYSLYPSNVSAKLGPKNPEDAAENISLSLRALAKQSNKEIASSLSAPRDDRLMENFLGVAIIDANDLGQNVLGNSTGLDNKLIEQIFEDNPMGQSNEQTPIVIVF